MSRRILSKIKQICEFFYLILFQIRKLKKKKEKVEFKVNKKNKIKIKKKNQASIDGAHFGTSFPHILFQVYPKLLPSKSIEKFTPRIYGFKIHPSAELYEKNSQKNKTQNTQIIQAKQSSRSQIYFFFLFLKIWDVDTL